MGHIFPNGRKRDKLKMAKSQSKVRFFDNKFKITSES